MARNPLNKELIQKLQDDASKLGVALALPEYILRLDATSQNHIVFVASQELVRMRAISEERLAHMEKQQ